MGLAVGVFFLTLNYHHVLWVFFGLAGAFYTATKLHDREFVVRFGWRDAVLLAASNLALLALRKVYILLDLGAVTSRTDSEDLGHEPTGRPECTHLRAYLQNPSAGGWAPVLLVG